jgi:ABC-2 type transport system permease protein
MSLKQDWELYKKSMSLEISGWMIYRFNFALFLIGLSLFNLFGPLLMYLIYSNNLSFPGWTFGQVLFMMGTFSLVTGLDHFWFESIAWKSSELIMSGRFDAYLIRPIKPLKYLCLSNPDIDALAEVVTGLAIILYSIYTFNIQITAISFLMYIIIIFAAILFLGSLNIFTASLNFIFVKAHSIMDFFYEIKLFGRYPLNIFGNIGYFIFTFIIPVGMIAFYPSQAILGRANWNIVFSSIITAVIFFGASLLAWNAAIKKYTSAGG